MSSPSQGRQAEKTFESGCVFPCIPISSCSWWGSGERHPDSATDTLPRRKNSYFRLEPGRATTPHIAFMRTLWWQMTNNPENSNLGKPPEFEVTHLCLTLCDPLDYSLPGSSVHGISQEKNTGVGCHFLFQGTFPTLGSNRHLLHWQADSLPLSQRGRAVAFALRTVLQAK